MLNEVLNYLNNYFPVSTRKAVDRGMILPIWNSFYQYEVDATFTTNDTISGDFEDTYLVGEYIRIENTRLNDGVYLITAIDDTSITVDATLDITISTEEEITTLFTKCNIPKQLVSLIADIKTYDSASNDGIKSETQGDRSVSYNIDSSWQAVYKNKLGRYKKLGW